MMNRITAPKRALVDMSSVIWTCLKAGIDKENGIPMVDEHGEPVLNTKGVQKIVNSARYGYDNSLNFLEMTLKELELAPHQLILVKEGMNSKQGRRALRPEYKAGRDKAPQEYEEFTKCRDMLLDLFCSLGAQVVWQDGVEADDVIGYLAKHLKGETWIVTNDKDLSQCIGGNVHLFRLGRFDENPFGDFNPKYVPVWLSLIGDSDEFPGAKGFGPKAAEQLLGVFGEEGLAALETLIQKRRLGDLAEDVGELPVLQKIIDSASDVELSYKLACLWTHKVNTLQNPLQWSVGMVKPREECPEQTLRKWAGVKRLVSAECYDEALAFLKAHVNRSPYFALDIETSTPPESDEWLQRQDKEEKVVDVFGSELTGFSITFGDNLQYTYYVTVDHVEEPGVTNITKDQAKAMIQALPPSKINWVHNASFELPVLFTSLGDMREECHA